MALERRLSGADIGVVVAYFVCILCVGFYAMCRSNRGTVSGYFLAGRTMPFWMVGASLFVSNIGSEHFIGLAGSGAAGGIGVGAWEFNAILLLQLLGWVFLPVYIACGIFTMPQYLSKRFGGQRLRVYFACLSLILYLFTKLSVDLYTGALFIQQSLGWDLYLSIIVLILIVAILTITGGLAAVIYTDTLQAFLMIFGAIALMIMGFIEIGGYDGLVRKYPGAVTNETVPNTTCHETSKHSFTMLRQPSDPDMPWPGFLFGQTPGSIWYWCADQVIVQRALAAKSLSHAQGATLMAGFIKILPLFIMVMPGMISRILEPEAVACVDPDVCYSICQSRAGCTNIAYPRLVLRLMPNGARGLMMAVMIAALMSDLDSIFNSASTLFTIDIYKRIRQKASVKELMIVGRLFVCVMVVVGIAWVPVVKETQGGQVFIYIQEITDYFAPPVAATFLIAILWKRCNEKGAFWGLMAGFVAGVVRLILIFVYRPAHECGEVDTRPPILARVHYMYFAILLFWLTTVVTIIVSLFTPPPEPSKIHRTTFWTRFDKDMSNVPMVDGEFGDKLGPVAAENGVHDDTTHTAIVKETGMQTVEDDEEIDGTKQEVGSRDSVDETVQTSPKLRSKGNRQEDYVVKDGNKQDEKQSIWLKGWNWFCGFASTDEDKMKLQDHYEHLVRITSLKQNPQIKRLLNIGLVVILASGVFLYCWFSLWKYQPDY
ncbi:sodium/myo-inositol cotransporter-like [Glandiceps talaboti]